MELDESHMGRNLHGAFSFLNNDVRGPTRQDYEKIYYPNTIFSLYYINS
jgi:hypothetical protein